MTPREEFGGDLRAQTENHEDRIVDLESDMTELTTVILGKPGPLGTRIPEGSMKWQVEQIYQSTNGGTSAEGSDDAKGSDDDLPKNKAFSFSVGEEGNVSMKVSKRASYLIGGVIVTVAGFTGVPVFDFFRQLFS